MNNIHCWFKQFQEIGLFVRQSPGRPAVMEEIAERAWQSFMHSPHKLIPRHSLELGIPKPTAHKVLHMNLKLHAYKIQLVHEIKAANKPKRKMPGEGMLEKIDNEPNFMHNIMFTDEAKIQINDCINQHNCWIWGSKNHFVRDSPKLYVWCWLMHNHIFGPFVFAGGEKKKSNIFLDMLKLFLFPQLDDLPNAGNIYLQMAGASPHYSDLVREALDEKFPNTWIG